MSGPCTNGRGSCSKVTPLVGSPVLDDRPWIERRFRGERCAANSGGAPLLVALTARGCGSAEQTKRKGVITRTLDAYRVILRRTQRILGPRSRIRFRVCPGKTGASAKKVEASLIQNVDLAIPNVERGSSEGPPLSIQRRTLHSPQAEAWVFRRKSSPLISGPPLLGRRR